jgi:hypothetical protein
VTGRFKFMHEVAADESCATGNQKKCHSAISRSPRPARHGMKLKRQHLGDVPRQRRC